MSSDDELSQLEELLGAEDFEDNLENASKAVELKSSASTSDLFLQDVAERDESILINGVPKVTPEKPVESEEKIKSSLIHNGDTDSSDDEERRNYTERKYNDYGMDIKKKLQHIEDSKIQREVFKSSQVKSSSKVLPKSPLNGNKTLITNKNEKTDIYTDPVFGIRLLNPLISGAALKERMQGRQPVSMSRLQFHVTQTDLSQDWTIAGVVIRKGNPASSQKGNMYSIITLSDLKDDFKTVALFLFGNAHKQLWKTSVGTVLGILNPNVLDRREGSKDQACLSVDNPERVLIMGKSKDFGFCKSRKKNGDACDAVVNTNQCEYCIYHIKQEYNRCSVKRAELQSSTAGRGLNALRNKVLGKDTVMYGGKLFSAIPPEKGKKTTERDKSRLQSLSGYIQATNGEKLMMNKAPTVRGAGPPVKKNAARVEVQYSQRKKDLERLEFLRASNPSPKSHLLSVKSNELSPGTNDLSSKINESSKVNSLSSKSNELSPKTNILSSKMTESSPKTNHLSIINGTSPLSNKSNNFSPKSNSISRTKLGLQQSKLISNNVIDEGPTLPSPTLGFGLDKSATIDFSVPFVKKRSDKAKEFAKNWILKNGPLQKNNPHNLKGTNEGKKRALSHMDKSSDGENEETEKPEKKLKTGVLSENFKKMMEATSSHADLVTNHDNEEVDKYFGKLAAKEAMEEKMLNTFKVPCKAVKCLKCLYTSFSASEKCRQEKHPLKVYDSFKRFFKCLQCGHRTTSLEIIPMHSCSNCKSSRWQKAAMMAEKKGVTLASTLSIRGEEETFIGNVQAGGNINLLVPDDQAS